jgi:hypothetical protein
VNKLVHVIYLRLKYLLLLQGLRIGLLPEQNNKIGLESGGIIVDILLT